MYSYLSKWVYRFDLEFDLEEFNIIELINFFLEVHSLNLYFKITKTRSNVILKLIE